MFQNLNFLIKTIRINKKKNPQVSYTANIFKRGKMFSIKKFMEEAKELSTSAKYSNKKKNELKMDALRYCHKTLIIYL